MYVVSARMGPQSEGTAPAAGASSGRCGSSIDNITSHALFQGLDVSALRALGGNKDAPAAAPHQHQHQHLLLLLLQLLIGTRLGDTSPVAPC